MVFSGAVSKGDCAVGKVCLGEREEMIKPALNEQYLLFRSLKPTPETSAPLPPPLSSQACAGAVFPVS